MCKPDCCCGECKPVMVYKDLRGSYHETQKECRAQNERIVLEQKAKIRENLLRTIFDSALGSDPLQQVRDYTWLLNQNSPREYWLRELMTNWKYIRGRLNEVKE